MNKKIMLILPILGLSLFAGCTSRSSDIPDLANVENPLPSCPDSPNCVRITKQIDAPLDTVFSASEKALQSMEPAKMRVSQGSLKIETVFRVVFFRDDMVLQLAERDSSSTYLHIRSASRIGKIDFGVNTRRVRKFLRILPKYL